MSVPGHFKAALGALAAGFGTRFQLRVHASADLFATASTSFAGLGANPTHIGVQVGAPKHEIGANEAHLCTILQAPDMICFDILAGLFKRILDGFGTSGMASVAIVDSRLHAFVSQHCSSSFENSDSDVYLQNLLAVSRRLRRKQLRRRDELHRQPKSDSFHKLFTNQQNPRPLPLAVRFPCRFGHGRWR